jgi:hypothetical protein
MIQELVSQKSRSKSFLIASGKKVKNLPAPIKVPGWAYPSPKVTWKCWVEKYGWKVNKARVPHSILLFLRYDPQFPKLKTYD